MKKNTVEVIVTGALMVILLILVITGSSGKRRAAREREAMPNSPSPELVARIESLKAKAAATDPEASKRQEERAALLWGRDPFFAKEP